MALIIRTLDLPPDLYLSARGCGSSQPPLSKHHCLLHQQLTLFTSPFLFCFGGVKMGIKGAVKCYYFNIDFQISFSLYMVWRAALTCLEYLTVDVVVLRHASVACRTQRCWTHTVDRAVVVLLRAKKQRLYKKRGFSGAVLHDLCVTLS